MYPASEWKFVSGMTHNYCILTNDKNIGVHKNSALRKVSNQQSYDAACAVLDRIPMVISQERRTNKMAHLETVLQNFCFK
jgi:ribosomal protein S26